MAGRIRMNTDWLTVCGGCHVALVDLHEKILQILGEVDILHCPLLTDVKDYPRADIGLLSGAVRNEHDIEVARRMRDACDVLIAYGTCAVYGGVPGAALAHSPDEILDCAYRDNPTTRGDTVPDRFVAGLNAQIVPLDEIVEVDLYLPGCPPHAAFIFDALINQIEGRPVRATGRTVCARCDRVMKKTDVAAIRQQHEAVPEAGVCLLSQGFLCMGSVTLDRCLAPCPQRGVVCSGCAGPTLQILTEPNRDIRTEIADRMSRLTAIPASEVVTAIEGSAKCHYAYSMASKMVGQKPTFLIHKWIAEVEQQHGAKD